ncbi:MAG: putative holin-like toxin [Oscillospiraceae bacterium]|nr:putative holin-like toxin [Oscillospiraceae bacterium]
MFEAVTLMIAFAILIVTLIDHLDKKK